MKKAHELLEEASARPFLASGTRVLGAGGHTVATCSTGVDAELVARAVNTFAGAHQAVVDLVGQLREIYADSSEEEALLEEMEGAG